MKRGFVLLVAAVLTSAGAAPPDASQVVAPIRLIKGSSTNLWWPSGVAVDRGGTIYVSNDGDLAHRRDAITVYGPTANGDVAPVRTISGDLTGLTRPQGLAVDSAGFLYVASAGVSGAGTDVAGQDRVLVFAPTASGDVAPVRYITDRVIVPKAVAIDATGLIYVSNYGAMNNGENSITVYRSGPSADPTPLRRIAGSHTTLDTPIGLAVGPRGDIFVVNSGRVNLGIDSIVVFAAGANGNATPVRVITGTKTQLNVPQTVSIDAAGYIYVTNFGSSSVTVYAPNASGNAAPVQLVAGPDALLGAYLEGTAIDSGGNFYVVNRPMLPTSDFSWVSVFTRANMLPGR